MGIEEEAEGEDADPSSANNRFASGFAPNVVMS
jgi:hypothetical protein